jgi:hypothetical protein
MENINEDNYESFFLDYYEGQLSAEQVAELMLFLQQHPELNEEFEELEIIPITIDETGVLPCKEEFKKGEVNKYNYEEFMVESMEGILDEEGETMLQEFLRENPEYQKDWAYFKRTIIQADLSIVLPDKEKLKRHKGIIIPLRTYPYMAVAASLALIFGLWFYNKLSVTEPNTKPSVANNNTVAPAQNKHDAVEPKQNETGTKDQSVSLASATNVIQVKKEHTYKEGNRTTPDVKQTALLFNTVPAELIQTENNPDAPEMALKEIPAYVASKETPAPVANPYPDLKALAQEKIMTTLKGSDGASKGPHHIGWELTKIAARGYGRLTGKKVRIQENYNENGMLVSYALQGGGFAYQKSQKE